MADEFVCERELKMVSILVGRRLICIHDPRANVPIRARETMRCGGFWAEFKNPSTVCNQCRCMYPGAMQIRGRRRAIIGWVCGGLILRWEMRDWLNPQTECRIKNARRCRANLRLSSSSVSSSLDRGVNCDVCIYLLDKGRPSTKPPLARAPLADLKDGLAKIN